MGGLYRGFAIHTLGSIPAGALYFGGYEWFKAKVLTQNQWFEERPFIAYLAGGIFAETVACLLFVPVDVIKERRQVQSDLKTYNYKNDLDAIRQIKATEGLKGLYRAYGATILSFGPFSALYFLFYEKIKEQVTNFSASDYVNRVKNVDQNQQTLSKKDQPKNEQDISSMGAMFCSMQAGILASVLTNPLDMAKLRLQVQRAG